MELGTAAGCHQRPERSFFVGGWQMPVCARCTGVFIGQLLALPALLLFVPQVGAAVLALPLALDGLTQKAGWRTSTNRLRLVTGLLAGFGLATAVLGVFASLFRLFFRRG